MPRWSTKDVAGIIVDDVVIDGMLVDGLGSTLPNAFGASLRTLQNGRVCKGIFCSR